MILSLDASRRSLAQHAVGRECGTARIAGRAAVQRGMFRRNGGGCSLRWQFRGVWDDGAKAWIRCFFDTIADQRRLVLMLRQQEVPLVLALSEGEAERFPLVMAEIRAEFRAVLEIPVEGLGHIVVLASRRIRASGIDDVTGLRCYT